MPLQHYSQAIYSSIAQALQLVGTVCTLYQTAFLVCMFNYFPTCHGVK